MPQLLKMIIIFLFFLKNQTLVKINLGYKFSMKRAFIKNSQLLKKRKQLQTLKNTEVLSFCDEKNYQFLSIKPNALQPALNATIKKKGNKLRNIASLKHLVYLTDNQISSLDSCFVIHQKPKDIEWIGEGYNKKGEFQFYVNPTIKKLVTPPQPFLQSCHSFPLINSYMDRSQKIQISYTKYRQQNGQFIDQRQEVQQELSGFKAIIFQHCIDHMQGKTFFDWDLNKGRFQINGYDGHFESLKFLIREYSLRIKQSLQKGTQNSEQSLKTKKNYERRIRKAFREEAQVYALKAKQNIEKIKL